MKFARPITLTTEERRTLLRWQRDRSTPARQVPRARIVLLAAEGLTNQEIAEQLRTAKKTVSLWRTRIADWRLAGIERDAPRPGRKPAISQASVRKILAKSTQEARQSATHWSTRTMAKAVGISHATVACVWKANGLNPNLVRTLKVSNDPNFAEKRVDVIGLYLDPPQHAIVLCVDEKSQIRALDRAQKSLPLYPGRCGTMTHDYKRNGTTTLFAALNMAEGIVIGECMPRHRHQGWIKFLKVNDGSTDPESDLHLIADNYGTHKHPKAEDILAKIRRARAVLDKTPSDWDTILENDRRRRRAGRAIHRWHAHQAVYNQHESGFGIRMQPPPLPIIDRDPAGCEATLRDIQRQHHVLNRQCGECTACCTVMVVNELRKPANVPCQHCSDKGCNIYESRPLTCRGWSCEWWLGRLGLTDAQRPDKLGLVFSFHPAMMVAHEYRAGAATIKEAIRVLNRIKGRMPVLFVPFKGSAFRLGKRNAREEIELAGFAPDPDESLLGDSSGRAPLKFRGKR